jgi:hypothetical protein
MMTPAHIERPYTAVMERAVLYAAPSHSCAMFEPVSMQHQVINVQYLGVRALCSRASTALVRGAGRRTMMTPAHMAGSAIRARMVRAEERRLCAWGIGVA